MLVGLQRVFITLIAPEFDKFLPPPQIVGQSIQPTGINPAYFQHQNFTGLEQDNKQCSLVRKAVRLCHFFHQYTQVLMKQDLSDSTLEVLGVEIDDDLEK